MEKRLSLIFGIIGGLLLTQLNTPPLFLASALSNMRGYVTDFLINILSIFGLIVVVFLSLVLIYDSLMVLMKK